MTKCKTCETFYGDSAPCDESKPACSPHRKPDGSPGPWPTPARKRRKAKGAGKDLTRLNLYPWPYAWEPRRPEGFTQPPKAHMKRPMPLSIHPLAWVNSALAHGRKIHKWSEAS